MTVHYEADDSVVVITIDRPEVSNAIDRPTAQSLADAMRRFDADPGSSVAVLTGASGKFCAGADLKAMSEGGERVSRVEVDGDGPVGPTRMLLSKPVIAAIEKLAVAGGLELACWCDLRIAATDTVFGVYCRRWGIPLMDGGTVRLPRLIGHSQALDLILTGRAVSGEEALRMGLVNRLVEPGRTLETALALAHEIAAFPQAAMRSDRMSTYEQWERPLSDALTREFRHGMATLHTGETFEGIRQFGAGERRFARLDGGRYGDVSAAGVGSATARP